MQTAATISPMLLTEPYERIPHIVVIQHQNDSRTTPTTSACEKLFDIPPGNFSLRRPISRLLLLTVCFYLTVCIAVYLWWLRSEGEIVTDTVHPQVVDGRMIVPLVHDSPGKERGGKQRLPSLSCEGTRPPAKLSTAGGNTATKAPFAYIGSVQLCHDRSESASFFVGCPVLPSDHNVKCSPLPVVLPLTAWKLDALAGMSQPSRFGVGTSDHLNPRLRSSREMAANRISLSESFHRSLNYLKEDIALHLIWPALPVDNRNEVDSDMIKLVPHKLLLYSDGDFFIRHRDTYKVDGQVATLIVLLPTEAAFEGGMVTVTRGDTRGGGEDEAEEVVWDAAKLPMTSQQDAAAEGVDCVPLHYMVFWSDCEHVVSRVKSGGRAALVFNVVYYGLHSNIAKLLQEENFEVS